MAEHKKKKAHANQAQPPPGEARREEAGAMNSEHRKMLEWLRKVKFRKKLFGGVDEADVWRKLEELNRLYEASLVAERARYDALLEAQTGSARDAPGESSRELPGDVSGESLGNSAGDAPLEFLADDDFEGV